MLADGRMSRKLVEELVGQVGEDRRLLFARSFVHRVVLTYWRAVLGRGCRDPRVCQLGLQSLVNGADKRADDLGRMMASLPREAAAFEISSLYTSMLPPELRSQMGAFFTPPALVQRLLDLVTKAGFDWKRHRALDPACGGGAFLAPLAERMVSVLRADGLRPREILESVTSRIAGIELDPFSAWMSQTFLELVLYDLVIEGGGGVPTLIMQQDALDMPERWASTGFDLVVGNPPYGKVTLSAAQRSHYSSSLFGHANLYGLFTHLAVRLVRSGGIIGYVTPTSFLGGQYFMNLRKLLLEQAPPVAIDFVADRGGVFDDVLQETMLAVFRRDGRQRETAISYLRPVEMNGPCRVVTIGKVPVQIRGSSDPWILPRTPDQAILLELRGRLTHSLHAYGYAVSTGPLVWNRHKQQLMTVAGRGRLPIVWAESVTVDGGFKFSAERRNHAPWLALHEGQDHLVLNASVILIQRTTAKEQSRRLVSAILPTSFIRRHEGVVVENHLNVIRPVVSKPGIDLKTLNAYLNSVVADQFFRCISGSVAVSAYELEALPLPDPRTMGKLKKLIGKGTDRDAVDIFLKKVYDIDYGRNPVTLASASATPS